MALVLATSAAGQGTPVAMGVTPDGEILVLDHYGRIWRGDPATPKLKAEPPGLLEAAGPPVEIKEVPPQVRALTREGQGTGLPLGRARALGLTVIQAAGRTEVVTTSYERLAGGANVLYISRRSLSGGKPSVQRLVTFGLFTGLAADPGGGKVYLSNTRTVEIYTLTLTEKPSLEPFAKPRGALVLGPLVVDRESQRLFVADLARGALFTVDITPGRSASQTDNQIAAGLGEPIALAFDSGSRRIYVADSARKQVWLVDPDGEEKPSRLPLATELQEPVALAVVKGGRLAVADAGRSLVYVFPPEGGAPEAVLRF